MNRHSFVDVENVGTYWTKLFEEMTDSDLMCLYTSENTKITYGVLIPYMHDTKWDQLEIKETIVMCKKDNNLDCFLLSDLNTKMKQNKGCDIEYFIISKDKGYDRFIDEMTKNGYNITRIFPDNEICEKTNEKENEDLKRENKKKDPVKKVDEKLKHEIAKQLKDSIIKNQGKKNHFENAYDYEKLAEIYITERDFKKVVESIKDKSNASRFSSFIKGKTRKGMERIIEGK